MSGQQRSHLSHVCEILMAIRVMAVLQNKHIFGAVFETQHKESRWIIREIRFLGSGSILAQCPS